MTKKSKTDKKIKMTKEGQEFEVSLGEDTFKVLLRINAVYPQHVVQAIASGMATSKVVIIPPKIDIIVVRNDGTVDVY